MGDSMDKGTFHAMVLTQAEFSVEGSAQFRT